jgi:hypothetical protein
MATFTLQEIAAPALVYLPDSGGQRFTYHELRIQAPIDRVNIPYITEVSPAVLSTISAGDVLSFRAVYPNGAMRGVIALKMAKVWELAFDGAQLGPGYRKQSTVESLVDGYRFNLRRDGGWPVSPVIFPLAYDIYGNENA